MTADKFSAALFLGAAIVAWAIVTCKAEGRVRGYSGSAGENQAQGTSRRTTEVKKFFAPSSDPFASIIPRESIPQFVVLTFDDSVTHQAIDLIRKSIGGVLSKDGCPIAATFYVSIAASDDSPPLTQCELIAGLRMGKHEIATHTYGHNSNPTEDDIIGAVDFLNETCGVPREEIRGFRTPNLGFTQKTFDRLHKLGFLYDSSISDSGLGSNFGTTWIWPYTMDSGIVQDCASSAGSCDQTKPNPGLWEVPMWRMYDSSNTAMIVMDWPGDAYETLSLNFQRRYDGNRAPLGIFLHPGWLTLNGQMLRQFAKEVLAKYDDVHFVTNYELLQWMSNPVPSSIYKGRVCSDVVADCFPPPAIEGGCGHGSFDVDKCACACVHPWGGDKCLTKISDSWTQPPTPQPTVAPTTMKPTLTATPSQPPTTLQPFASLGETGSDGDESSTAVPNEIPKAGWNGDEQADDIDIQSTDNLETADWELDESGGWSVNQISSFRRLLCTGAISAALWLSLHV